MDLLDVFNSDAFSMVSLTARVNSMPFVPGRIGRLGIFEEMGITTTQAVIEEEAGSLALIPNTPRSAPSNQNLHAKRKVRNLTVPHLPLDDTIMADEVQGVRAFGGSELQSVQSVFDGRLRMMKAKHDATVEYGRIGAIKGVIYDADGSTVIYNLFTEFGVSQDSVDFVLGTTTTNILGKCADGLGYIEDALGMNGYEAVRVVCGKTWWKKFISHDLVRDAYKYFEAQQQKSNPLREDLRYKGFEFGGMIFEQYRGSVGGVDFVAASEAHAFPIGVPELYKTVYAPADFMETVNTPGLPIYVRTKMKDYNRGMDVHTQSNPLSFCTRPKCLVKFTTSN